ncbi:hypothetical protein LTR37_004881 [Vermiconidia calcicola]|uniref:Uncharacterized protein n=1 Tax=Vermiconidia calcicola TaxID=1690605 RepID=A0ACC3NL06_9PEZI|nr:hypothetical protein LTR37_004881 [Vermiconidia calcicola]
MAAAVAARSSQSDVFRSVFPKTNFTTPTPESTPNLASMSSPGQAFGGFNMPSEVTHEVRYSRAWSVATRYLSLQPNLQSGSEVPDAGVFTTGVQEAFSYLLQSHSAHRELLSWYGNEIGTDLRNGVLSELELWKHPVQVSSAMEALQQTLEILQRAQQHYFRNLNTLISKTHDSCVRDPAINLRDRVKQTLHTMVLHSLPRQRLQQTLASVMFQQLHSSLSSNSNPEKCIKDDKCHCRLDLAGLPLKELYDVGLGGLVGERAFAHAVDRFLQGPAIARRCFQVDWTGHSSVMQKLRSWISEHLLPVVDSALTALTGHTGNTGPRLTQEDRQQFLSIATINLGRLRVLALFDYVKSWPASTGAILDIWEYLNAGGPGAKAHVCHSFSQQIQQRLLHAGATTSEILSIYVNVIHAFKSLDSRGVLFDKVALPIRNYLRARDDTVSVIAASFLADMDEAGNVVAADMDKICPDITLEVSNTTLQESRDNRLLDWNDMDWMPDPIDAGPDYKSSKSEDVVAHILGLFEQDEFIKEVTTVLAQHLLHATDSEYIKETRLVELFKSRLDVVKLQAAEVMLKDMRDSVALGKRINPAARHGSTQSVPTPREIQAAIPEEGITLPSLYNVFGARMKQSQFLAAVKLVANKRNDLFYAKRTRIPPDPAGSSANEEDKTNFKAQILSSFFWPQLRSNEFKIPSTLEPLQTTFESRFSMLGSQRKLQFRPALTRVSMRLELEDRTIEETDVPGWRASVVDAFASLQDADTAGVTVPQLMEALSMEEELVTDALNFWTNRKVLYQRAPGSYSVLERLDMDVGAAQGQVQQTEEILAVKSQDAMLRESAPVFEAFIGNMLRNQGAKEIGGMMGITNLLKMVMPGFTYGDDEVKWLLGEMEKKGQVKRDGEAWSVVG